MNGKSEFHQHPVVRIVPLREEQEEQGEARAGRGMAGAQVEAGAEDRGGK